MTFDELAHPHIANIGLMVEEMENKMRSTLNEIYFGKTKDIVNDLRQVLFNLSVRPTRCLRIAYACAPCLRPLPAPSPLLLSSGETFDTARWQHCRVDTGHCF